MDKQSITIEQTDLRKLLAAASGDAVLLFLHMQGGGDLAAAESALQMTKPRLDCAAATLRQLGLWQEEKRPVLMGERPTYSEKDVLSAINQDSDFRMVYGEVQRLLGRTLNTEEMKILLSFGRYLGLPCEVISLLVSYCKDRARQKGNLRNPSLRAVEKEAYRWAEMGIDTLEEAVAYIQNQNLKNTRLSRLMELLQIRGRSLTAAEEKYALSWLEMGISDEVLAMAYERTCLNTGGMRWPYMNKILTKWQEAGYKTAEQVRSGGRKGAVSQRQLDKDEQAAIARMMQEG